MDSKSVGASPSEAATNGNPNARLHKFAVSVATAIFHTFDNPIHADDLPKIVDIIKNEFMRAQPIVLARTSSSGLEDALQWGRDFEAAGKSDKPSSSGQGSTPDKLAEAYARIERLEGLLDEFWPANTPSWRK